MFRVFCVLLVFLVLAPVASATLCKPGKNPGAPGYLIGIVRCGLGLPPLTDGWQVRFLAP